MPGGIISNFGLNATDEFSGGPSEPNFGGGGSLPVGTDGQTLRFNGTTLEATSLIEVRPTAVDIYTDTAPINLVDVESAVPVGSLVVNRGISLITADPNTSSELCHLKLNEDGLGLMELNGNSLILNIPSRGINKVLLSDDNAGACSWHSIADFGMITKDLTNNVSNDLFEVALPAGASTLGELHLILKVADANNLETYLSTLTYAATNEGGGVISIFYTNGQNTFTNNGTTDITGNLNIVNGGVIDFSSINSVEAFSECVAKLTVGTNKVTCSITPAWSGTPTLLKIYYRFIVKTPETITYL